MNKLEMVNRVLVAASRRPASALDTNGPSDTAHAERYIDIAAEAIQTEGWNFNTRRKMTLTPANDGTITVPAGVLVIDTDGANTNSTPVTQQGDGLYNLLTNSNTFTEPISVIYILKYKPECIPPHIQEYVVAKAAASFNRARGDKAIQQVIERDAREARVKCVMQDERIRGVNVLDSYESLVATGRLVEYPRSSILGRA